MPWRPLTHQVSDFALPPWHRGTMLSKALDREMRVASTVKRRRTIGSIALEKSNHTLAPTAPLQETLPGTDLVRAIDERAPPPKRDLRGADDEGSSRKTALAVPHFNHPPLDLSAATETITLEKGPPHVSSDGAEERQPTPEVQPSTAPTARKRTNRISMLALARLLKGVFHRRARRSAAAVQPGSAVGEVVVLVRSIAAPLLQIIAGKIAAQPMSQEIAQSITESVTTILLRGDRFGALQVVAEKVTSSGLATPLGENHADTECADSTADVSTELDGLDGEPSTPAVGRAARPDFASERSFGDVSLGSGTPCRADARANFQVASPTTGDMRNAEDDHNVDDAICTTGAPKSGTAPSVDGAPLQAGKGFIFPPVFFAPLGPIAELPRVAICPPAHLPGNLSFRSVWTTKDVNGFLSSLGEKLEGIVGSSPLQRAPGGVTRPPTVPEMEMRLVVQHSDRLPLLPPAALPRKALPSVRVALGHLLLAGAIRPSSSTYSSPVVVNWDGSNDPLSLAFLAVDYSTLNSALRTETMHFCQSGMGWSPSQRFRLAGEMPVSPGYLSLSIREQDRHYTAFDTPFGKFEWNVAPLNLLGVNVAFCKFALRLFRKQLGNPVAIAAWGIAVLGANEAECERHAVDALHKLSSARFFSVLLSPLKGAPGLPSPAPLKKLLRIDSSDPRNAAILIVPRKTSFDISKAKLCTKVVPTLSMLLKDYAGGDEKMRNLGQILMANPTPQNINAAKVAVQRAAEDARPVTDVEWTIYCDASQTAIGGFLVADQHGQKRAIDFASRPLHAKEKSLKTEELETLAVLYALRCFKATTLGRPIRVYTDNMSTRNSFAQLSKSLIGRGHGAIDASCLDVTIFHVPGKQNVVADALSRCT